MILSFMCIPPQVSEDHWVKEYSSHLPSWRASVLQLAGDCRANFLWNVIKRIEMTSSQREQKGYSRFFVALIHLRNNQAEQTQQENLHLLNWLRYLRSQARHQRDVCSFPDWLHQEVFFLLISLISKTYQALWSFNMTVFMLLLHTTDGSLCKYYCAGASFWNASTTIEI